MAYGVYVIPEVVYYKKGDREPVAEFIDELADKDPDAAAKVRAHLRALAAEGPLSPALDTRHLGDGLWELKVRTKVGQHRIFYCVSKGILWLLHAITKKSGKTPKRDMKLARKRKKEVEES